jgi:hypothetical protein
MVARDYRSFLVRYWRLDARRRVEVAHIQSGAAARLGSLVEAAAWMAAQCGESAEAIAPAMPTVVPSCPSTEIERRAP